MKTTKGILVVLFAAGVSVAIAIAFATWNTEKKAAALLSEVERMQIGGTGEEVQEIAAQFSAYATKAVDSRCTSGECNLTLGFENAWLRRLHLAPPTKFGVVLLVRDGSVYHINVAMLVYADKQTIGVETTLSEKSNPRIENTIETIRSGQIAVRLSPRATLEQRKAAFSFNLACLHKLGGCKDTRDLLPYLNTKEQASSQGGWPILSP